MNARAWVVGLRRALWITGAAAGIALQGSPGLFLDVARRAQAPVVRAIATLGVPSAQAAETLKFRPVPPESETAVERRAERRAEPESIQVVVPPMRVTVPVPPNPPGVLVTRSGDVMRLGSDIHVEKDEVVKGDVTALKGDITVDGHVEGNVVAMFGDVYLNSTARVDGDVVCMRGELHEQPGAVVTGQRVTALSREGRLHVREERPVHEHHPAAGAALVALIVFVAIAWGAALLTPGRLAASLETLERQPMLSFGITMLVLALIIPSLIALAIVVALLCITVIGIPLAMAALLAYALFLAALCVWGWATGAALVGRWIARRRGAAGGDVIRWTLFGSLAVMGWIVVGAVLAQAGAGSPLGGLGVLILVLGWISFGFLCWFGAGSWLRSELATGLLGRWWAGRRRRTPVPPVPPTPPTGPVPPGPPVPPVPPAPEPPPPPSPPETFAPPPADPFRPPEATPGS